MFCYYNEEKEHRMAGFPGTGKIWMNGALVDWADAKIHVASHVIHYGSGVFEGARCYETVQGPACFRLDAHIRRLIDSARIYRMDSPYDQQATFTDAVIELIKVNRFKACYIRPLLYRGYDQLGVNPVRLSRRCGDHAVGVGRLLHEGRHRGGPRREGLDLGPHRAEHHAGDGQERRQLRQLAAHQDGSGYRRLCGRHRPRHAGQPQRRQRPERLHRRAMASSTRRRSASSILSGITRDSVITIARDLGFEVREQVLPREMLYVADEVFFVGTAVEVTPIKSVDKITVGAGRRGPITEAIQQRFFDIVSGDAPDTPRLAAVRRARARLLHPARHPPIRVTGGPRGPPSLRHRAYPARWKRRPGPCTSTTYSRLPSRAARPTFTARSAATP